MNIDIICVGKIKEAYFRDGIAEYHKRMSRYAKVKIIEVQDEKTINGQSKALDDIVLQTEAERIIKNIREDAYVITLEIQGKQLTSEELSQRIEELQVSGVSNIQFIIGGSLGLHDSIISKANMHLSFSKMTFPHQMMRMILLEQIYRSYRIIHNEPYHK